MLAPASQGEPELRYRRRRAAHWDQVARRGISACSRYYRHLLTGLYRFLVPPGQRVLEIGCGKGDLLSALEPSFGVGVDISGEMVTRAKKRHPHLHFLQADAHSLPLRTDFDVIILSDVVNDLWDVEAAFKQLNKLVSARTRITINVYSRLWEIPLKAAQAFRLATPVLPQNWLTPNDLRGLLELADLELVKSRQEVLLPLPIPGLSTTANRYFAKLWPMSHAALTNILVARPARVQATPDPLVSVIVPARNEAGNIEAIFSRVPEMGAGTEIVFVEGNSTDDTYGIIESGIRNSPNRNAVLYKQPGEGKGDAVRFGFARSKGEILMILDADLTVRPEDLPRFYDAIVSGKGDLINGVRLVYPMEREAMRFLNLVGNKFFSVAFTWLLDQPMKDTLCGTKVLWKSDYQKIEANRSYFGDFDPFGDFDLLFGASKLNMRIIDLPVRYQERTYGATNIDRWRHGMLLLRMVAFAARRIKFV